MDFDQGSTSTTLKYTRPQILYLLNQKSVVQINLVEHAIPYMQRWYNTNDHWKARTAYTKGL